MKKKLYILLVLLFGVFFGLNVFALGYKYNNYIFKVHIPGEQTDQNFENYSKKISKLGYVFFYANSPTCNKTQNIDQNPNIEVHWMPSPILSSEQEFPGDKFAKFVENNTWEPAGRFKCFSMAFVINASVSGYSLILLSQPVRFSVNSIDNNATFNIASTTTDLPDVAVNYIRSSTVIARN